MTVSSFHKRSLSSIKFCMWFKAFIKSRCRLGFQHFPRRKSPIRNLQKVSKHFCLKILVILRKLEEVPLDQCYLPLLKISKNQHRKTLLLRNYCRRQGPMKNRNFLKKLGFLTVLATKTSQVLKKYVSSHQQQ